MLKQLKKFLRVIVTLVLLSSIFSINTSTIYADTGYSRNEFIKLESDRKFEYLETRGLELPPDFATNKDIAIEFIDTHMSFIIDGKFDNNLKPFSYDQSNIFLSNLKETLELQKLKDKTITSTKAAYVLKDSTELGPWFNSYLNYNCYAYSLIETSGKTQEIYPVNHFR